ncbi:hypothetical protein RJ639_003608, partial [Escallonia herrerae]
MKIVRTGRFIECNTPYHIGWKIQALKYILDDDLQLRTVLDEHGSKTDGSVTSHFSKTELSWLPDI